MAETVILGARSFALRPLKLGQLRRLLDALDELQRAEGGAAIDAGAAVVAAGLAPAHPDLTADAVLDIEATMPEFNAAVAAVLRNAGLQTAEPTGEAAPQPGS